MVNYYYVTETLSIYVEIYAIVVSFDTENKLSKLHYFLIKGSYYLGNNLSICCGQLCKKGKQKKKQGIVFSTTKIICYEIIL